MTTLFIVIHAILWVRGSVRGRAQTLDGVQNICTVRIEIAVSIKTQISNASNQFDVCAIDGVISNWEDQLRSPPPPPSRFLGVRRDVDQFALLIHASIILCTFCSVFNMFIRLLPSIIIIVLYKSGLQAR